MKFIKKPVVVEATQWFKNGDHPKDYTKDEIVVMQGEQKTISAVYRKLNNWEGDVVRYYRSPTVDGKAVCKYCGKIMHEHGWIETLEGGHIVCPGDWIITGIRSEMYPCKPDIFAATYDKWCSEEDMAAQHEPEGGLVDKLRKEMSEQSRRYEASQNRIKELEDLLPGAAWFIRRCLSTYPAERRPLAEYMARQIEAAMRGEGSIGPSPLLAKIEAQDAEIKKLKEKIDLLGTAGTEWDNDCANAQNKTKDLAVTLRWIVGDGPSALERVAGFSVVRGHYLKVGRAALAWLDKNSSAATQTTNQNKDNQ